MFPVVLLPSIKPGKAYRREECSSPHFTDWDTEVQRKQWPLEDYVLISRETGMLGIELELADCMRAAFQCSQ